MNKMNDKREMIDLKIAAAIFIAAMAARLIYFYQIHDLLEFRALIHDARYYHEWALRILSGNLTGEGAFYASPLYAYFLAAIYKTAGVNQDAVCIAQFLMGSFSAVFIFLITKNIFSRTSGILAGAIAVFYGPFVFHEGLLLKISLEIFLVSTAFLLLLKARLTGRISLWTASGICFGLAILTKGNSLIFIPFAIAWILIDHRVNSWRPKFIRAASFCLGCAAIVSLATIHNYMVSRDYVLTEYAGGYAFYVGQFHGGNGIALSPDFVRADPRYEEADLRFEAERRAGRALKPSEISHLWFREAFGEMASYPGFFLENSARKLRTLVSHDEPSDNYPIDFYRRLSPVLHYMFVPAWPIISLGLLGLIFSFGQTAQRQRSLPLYAFLATYSASLLAFCVNGRYRLMIIWALIPLAGFAIAGSRRLYSQDKKKFVAAAIICLIIPAMPSLHFDDGELSNTYNSLGMVEIDGKMDEAAEFYRKSLAAEGANHAARINLIEVEIRQGKIAEARSDALLGLKYFSGVAQYCLLLDMLDGMEAMAPKARIQRMRDIYSREGMTRLGIHDAVDGRFRYLMRMGRMHSANIDGARLAAQFFEGALKMKPGSAIAAQSLASVYYLLEDHERTGYFNDLAQKIAPLFLIARYNLAMEEMIGKRYGAAIDRLNAIAAIMPDYSAVQFSLGYAFAATGNKKQASHHYETFILQRAGQPGYAPALAEAARYLDANR